MLTREMASLFEKAQCRALKIIYGSDMSYNNLLRLGDMKRVDMRRRDVFLEEKARTEKLRNSPIFQMRKYLNKIHN